MDTLSTMQPKDMHAFETYEYEGVHLPLDTLRSTMDELKTFHIRQDDAFITSFPKSGTTWTQEIMCAVLHDGNIETLNKSHTWVRVPILEMTNGGYDNRDMPRSDKVVASLPTNSPRLIKSHLPGQLLPPQVWEKKIKMVYLIRNPKDVVVSFFHNCELKCPLKKIHFDEIFDMFMSGTVPYGRWWEHFLYFWEKRHEEQFLFIRYEDMIKDLRGNVKRISEFLGKSLSDDIIDVITDHCSFENMKKNPMTNPDTILKTFIGGEIPEGKSFMRKGKIGDWKTHLSESQNEALNAFCKEKLEGAGLSFDM